MPKEESFEDWWNRTYLENIEEKIKNGTPLSELEWSIHSTSRDSRGSAIVFIIAFIITPLLLYIIVMT